MPTTQTIHIQTYDYGASLSSATLRVVSTDVLVATADSVNEVTADSGLYAAVFGEVSVIAAGEYRLRAVVSGKPINRYVTLAGTDGEIVEARNERLAVLDSGITDQFDAIETAVDAGNNYHVTTLARLGSWAGTGVNTILGAFRAIAAKLPGITPTDISSGTSYNNAAHSLEAAATIANTAIAPSPLERNPTDTGVITFAWPVSGATITGTVSIDNSEYVAVAGNIAFLREDSGRYYYTLSYDAADRPAAAGSARYTLTDGEYTRYVILRVVESGDTGEATAMAVLKLDWQTVTGEVPSRSVLNALRHIRNKWALDGHTKTVYAEDDATPAYTTTVTADGTGNITADTPN